MVESIVEKMKGILSMQLLGSILNFFESTMQTPTVYGWFHILFVLLVSVATVLICVKYKNCDEKTLRRMIFVLWLVMVVLEIYKQLVYTFSFEDGVMSSDYQWYAFPFQLCSTPIFALPFVIFLKDGPVREAFISYSALFAFFGGFVVFIYPGDVFVSTIGINIQSMVHHGIQIISGIFLVVHRRRAFNFKFLIKGLYVFCGFIVAAMLMNVAVYHAFVAAGIDETFNMFYISPYFDCTLPLLSLIYPRVPYALFFVIYTLGFFLAALVIYLVERAIIRAVEKRYAKG